MADEETQAPEAAPEQATPPAPEQTAPEAAPAPESVHQGPIFGGVVHK